MGNSLQPHGDTPNDMQPLPEPSIARAAINAEKASRSEKCRQEILACLEKYHCRTQFIEVKVNGQLQQSLLEIVALD